MCNNRPWLTQSFFRTLKIFHQDLCGCGFAKFDWPHDLNFAKSQLVIKDAQHQLFLTRSSQKSTEPPPPTPTPHPEIKKQNKTQNCSKNGPFSTNRTANVKLLPVSIASRKADNSWKTPLLLCVVRDAIPAMPEIHMDIKAESVLWFQPRLFLKFYYTQLVPAAGQVSKIIYNFQFGADAIALRKEGGRGERERGREREDGKHKLC